MLALGARRNGCPSARSSGGTPPRGLMFRSSFCNALERLERGMAAPGRSARFARPRQGRNYKTMAWVIMGRDAARHVPIRIGGIERGLRPPDGGTGAECPAPCGTVHQSIPYHPNETQIICVSRRPSQGAAAHLVLSGGACRRVRPPRQRPLYRAAVCVRGILVSRRPRPEGADDQGGGIDVAGLLFRRLVAAP